LRAEGHTIESGKGKKATLSKRLREVFTRAMIVKSNGCEAASSKAITANAKVYWTAAGQANFKFIHNISLLREI